MTDFTTIARPYSRAVFEYARDTGAIEAWSDRLALLAAVVSNDEIKVLLDNPRISRQERTALLIKVCREHLDQAGENFIRLLAENSRLTALPAIAREYEHYCADLKGMVEATLVSAQEIDPAAVASIGAALEKRLGKKVSLQSEIDTSLIGGAVIKAGDLVIDGSMKSRLEKLSQILAH